MFLHLIGSPISSCSLCLLSSGSSAVLQVVDTLCQRLLSSDLLIPGTDGGGGQGEAQTAWPRVTPPSQSITNPLLISC